MGTVGDVKAKVVGQVEAIKTRQQSLQSRLQVAIAAKEEEIQQRDEGGSAANREPLFGIRNPFRTPDEYSYVNRKKD